MCVLRASGTNTAIKDFLGTSSLVPGVIFDDEYFSNHPNRNTKKFGFNVTLSEAEFSDLGTQINDSVHFLRREQQEIKRLVEFKGVNGVSVDFAISTPSDDIVVWTRSFPPELLTLLGAIGVALDFSIYR